MLHYASCCDLGIRQLVLGSVDKRQCQCGHLMLPGPGQGDQSPQCRVAQHTTHRTSSLHSDVQFARSSTCPVQWGSLHWEWCQSGVVSVPAASSQRREIVNVALRGEEWCSPSLTTAQFKYVCGWWCMTKLPPARPSPVTGTKGCLHSRVCPQFYTTSEHWTWYSIQ